MNYTYHEHRSRIVDQLLFPSTAKDWLQAYKDILTSQQLGVLSDELAIMSEFERHLRPYQKDITKFYLSVSPVATFTLLAYQDCLNRGEDPEDIDAFFAIIGQYSETTVRELLWRLLDDQSEHAVPDEDKLIDILDRQVDGEQFKWHFYWAYKHPKSYLKGLLDLYHLLLPIYKPYHDSTRDTCHSFGENLDIEELYKDSDYELDKIIKKSGLTNCEVFVISSWYPFNAISYDTSHRDGNAYCFVYPKVALLLKTETELTQETMTLTLKGLADETRYQVLLECLKEGVKSKDIARKFGITSANVTFHLQKLINGGVLQFETEDNGNRYKLNRDLLRQLIKRLEKDFEL